VNKTSGLLTFGITIDYPVIKFRIKGCGILMQMILRSQSLWFYLFKNQCFGELLGFAYSESERYKTKALAMRISEGAILKDGDARWSARSLLFGDSGDYCANPLCPSCLPAHL
jgi:hypothetical protein